MFSRARFTCSLFILTGVLAAGSRGTAQSGPESRMMLIHFNPQNTLSLLDTDQPPNPGTPTVGKFISGTTSPARILEGQAWPDPVNPVYLYGYTPAGTLRKVGPTGAAAGATDLTNYFSQITAATMVTSRVPTGDNNRSVCSGYDLKEHYAIVGQLNPGNPSLGGNSAGLMLINPATMSAYKVGAVDLFYAPSTQAQFHDLAFCVWPGPDGNYDTPADNEYRYVMAYQPDGASGGGVVTLSLNFHETQDGIDNNPWHPVTPTRGPNYTNVYPRMDANSKFGTSVTLPSSAVPGTLRVASWHLRANIPNVDYALASAERPYVAATWSVEYPGTPTIWRPWFGLYNLGQETVTGVPNPMLYSSPRFPQGHPYCDLYATANCVKWLTIVGDWAFATIGETTDGFGDHLEIIYLPEAADGAPPTELPAPDDGHRGIWAPSGVNCGFAGSMNNMDNSVAITYLGTGVGESTIFGTIRSPYVDYPGSNLPSAGAGMTPIDCHTDEERLMGMNIRQGPQPFTGFYQSIDPVENFPGMEGGGGKGSGTGGGCSGSASGGASAVACAALLVFAALTVKVLRS